MILGVFFLRQNLRHWRQDFVRNEIFDLVDSVNPLEDCKRVEISSEPNSHFRACCKLGWTDEVQNENK